MAKDKHVLILDDDAEWMKEVVLWTSRLYDSESLRVVSVNHDKELRRLLRDHKEFQNLQNLILDPHDHHQGKERFSAMLSFNGDVAVGSLFDKNHRLVLTCPYAKEHRPDTPSEGAASDEELRPDPRVERAIVPEEEPWRAQLPPPPLADLCHLLQTRFPVLYDQVLEPTFADLRYEHSVALREGHPGEAHWILLRGCGALAAAAARQLGFSLLDRIAAFWKTRSIK